MPSKGTYIRGYWKLDFGAYHHKLCMFSYYQLNASGYQFLGTFTYDFIKYFISVLNWSHELATRPYLFLKTHLWHPPDWILTGFLLILSSLFLLMRYLWIIFKIRIGLIIPPSDTVPTSEDIKVSSESCEVNSVVKRIYLLLTYEQGLVLVNRNYNN